MCLCCCMILWRADFTSSGICLAFLERNTCSIQWVLKIVAQVHVHLLLKLRRCDIFMPKCFNWYWGIFFKPWSFVQWKLEICFNCFNSKSLNTWSYPAMKNQAFSSSRSFHSKAPLSDITWWTYTFSSWNNIYKSYSPNKVSTETNFKEYW